MLYSCIRYYCRLHIFKCILNLIIQYIVYSRFLGHSRIKPQHFSIMIVHAGLCHAGSFMHEWHTQSSISYEQRHVSLPLQANGSACITHPIPCSQPRQLEVQPPIQHWEHTHIQTSECVFHPNISRSSAILLLHGAHGFSVIVHSSRAWTYGHNGTLCEVEADSSRPLR